ncbi:MAG: carboxypeptidase-like regulatory domain-containing protein [Planctomycetes bacterium]|nr:carboxypeptidase-like regulatory domain-containing protein [Planctomycetota bacterium]
MPPAPPSAPPTLEEPVDTDRVTGRVLAEDGTPIGGATVACLGTRVVVELLPTGERVPTPDRDETSATTAADGSFFLDGVRRHVSHTVRASAPLHGRVLLDFDPAPGAPGLVDLGEIRLPFGRALEGIALDGNGEGIPGARVRARNTTGERGRLRPGRPAVSNATSFLSEEAPTDSHGRFRFEGLAPGEYDLRLEGSGVPPVEERVTVPRHRDLAGVRLQVVEGASVTFVLVDGHGVPVAGEQVRVWGRGAPRDDRGAASSDGEGRAVLRGLPRTGLTFQIARRVSPDRDPPFAPEERGPLVPDGQEVRVVLHPFASIKGTVVDGKGSPLHRMQIGVYEEGRWLNSLSAFSDERGAFRVDFAAGRPVELRVERFQGEGNRGARGEPVKRYRGTLGPLTAPAEGVVLRCTEAAADRSLKVLVLDGEGRALPGVLVDHQDELGPRVEETDDRGLARFEGMVAEPAWLSIRALGPTVLPEGVLWPAPAEAVPAGQTVRMACRRGVPLEGVVRNREGEPLAAAKVTFSGPVHDVASLQTVTDAEGRFRAFAIPGAVIGELKVLWTGPAGERLEARRRNVPAGAGLLEIVARPGS